MAQTTLTIRIDENVKAQFNEVCDAMGIPATTALTIFIRRVIRDREIPSRRMRNPPILINNVCGPMKPPNLKGGFTT